MEIQELLERSLYIPSLEFEYNIHNIINATFTKVFSPITDDVFLLYDVHLGEVLNNELTFVDSLNIGKLIYTENEPKPFLIQESKKVYQYMDISGGFVSLWINDVVQDKCKILKKPVESDFFFHKRYEEKQKNELNKKHKW